MWTKVRCGGGVRMGVEGRKFVGAGAGVRRCGEEGVLRRARAYGCGRAQIRSNVGAGAEMCGERCATEGALVRRCVEEGALRWVRGCGDVWRKVRSGGGVRMGVVGRKFVRVGAKVRCGGVAGWVWKGESS